MQVYVNRYRNTKCMDSKSRTRSYEASGPLRSLHALPSPPLYIPDAVRFSVRISVRAPAILNDDCHGFPQSLQASVGIVPRLPLPRFIPVHQSPYDSTLLDVSMLRASLKKARREEEPNLDIRKNNGGMRSVSVSRIGSCCSLLTEACVSATGSLFQPRCQHQATPPLPFSIIFHRSR
jgi:hypothetical protein